MANSEEKSTVPEISTDKEKLLDTTRLKTLAMSGASSGDTISMWNESVVDEFVDNIRALRIKANGLIDSLRSAESALSKYSWYQCASRYSEFTAHNINKLLNSSDLSSETFRNILQDDGKEDGGLEAFYNTPNFAHLAGAIEEIKNAIIDYSKGTNMYKSRDILSTWVRQSDGDDSFLGGGSSFDTYTGSGTFTAPVVDSINKDKTADTTPVFSTDVEKNNELDGAENIPMKDSVTDDITNVSAKDLLVDAVKDTTDDSTIVTAGVASVLGSTFTKSNSSLNSLIKSKDKTSKFEAGKVDDIIEPEEPIPSLEEDNSNVFDDVVSTVTSFVTPQVSEATIDGKKVKGNASSVAIPVAAGVGVVSAGTYAGKAYMDKKKHADNDENEDEEKNDFDDFEFKDVTNEEVPAENNSNDSIVDFKNKIMDDNL